jgi:peptide deformylase
MKRDILIYPDATLLQPSATIEEPGTVRELAADLIETMMGNGGAGLAAVQVGEPVKLFVVRNEDEAAKPLVCINPTWRFLPEFELKEMAKEGCLSFPGFFEEVERFTTIEATYTDVEGIEYVQVFKGLQAQVFQHETEHLFGKLLVDNLNFTKANKLKMHMKQYHRRPQETIFKALGLDPRQFKNMQRQTGARRTS